MMEKGSFHTSTTEDLVRNVALPNQLPRGIEFDELPLGSSKSSALESLIGQNEDLMARLSVSLRRGSEFEEKIDFLEKENTGIRSRFEALKEQYMVLQEKDRISASRTLELHEESILYRKQSEKLEKLYADLYIQAQSFQKRLLRSERNQARVLKAARNLQKKAKASDQLRLELDHTVSIQQHTVQSYEARIDGLRHEIEGMKSKVQERDSIFETKLKLENQLLHEQRQNSLRDSEVTSRIDKLGRENANLRLQVKETLVANESQRLEIERLSTEVPHLKQVCENLTEQVESLQALWNHKQKEIETMEEKNRSLQKLNQTISLTLNQQRKEIHGLEQELEKERFNASEQLKILQNEIVMLRDQLKTSRTE